MNKENVDWIKNLKTAIKLFGLTFYKNKKPDTLLERVESNEPKHPMEIETEIYLLEYMIDNFDPEAFKYERVLWQDKVNKLKQKQKQMNKTSLTPEDIENAIVKEEYHKVGTKTTICVLTLKNSFEVIGKSGCVDPNNYDHEIGSKIAKEKAVDQVWLLEGYRLQQSIYEVSK